MGKLIDFADSIIHLIGQSDVALSGLTAGDSYTGEALNIKDPKVVNNIRFVLTELGLKAHNLTRTAGDGKTAGDSAGLYRARALEYFDPRFFEFEMKEANFRKFLKVSNVMSPGEEVYSYAMERIVGKTEPSADDSGNITEVDIIEEEFKAEAHEDAVKFSITTGDIRRAVLTGRPIEARKARAAYKVAEQKMHKHFLVDGLINSPYVASDEVADGAGASKLFVNKTPKEIVVGDVGSMIEAVRVATFNNHKINILGLPIEQDNVLNLEWISDQFPKPIKQWMLEQLKSYGIEEIVPIPELNGTGVGGTDHMIGWEMGNEDVIEAHIPMEVTWLPAQIDGRKIVFIAEFKYVDTVIRRPQAIRKAHGI